MAEAQNPFSAHLPVHQAFAVRKPAVTQHQKIEKQAQKLVADTFYGTLMRQMHDSPFKSEMFSGGRGGEAFQNMLDQRLSDHMAASTHNPLVSAVVHKLERPVDAKGRPVHQSYHHHDKALTLQPGARGAAQAAAAKASAVRSASAPTTQPIGAIPNNVRRQPYGQFLRSTHAAPAVRA